MPTNPFATSQNEGVDQETVDLKMRGLNKSFVESAQKLYERSPEADFTKLFRQYSQHMATFSVGFLKVTAPVEPTHVAPAVSTFNFPKPAPIESIKPVDPVKPAASINPFKPVEPAKPIEWYVESFEPIESFKPAEPTKVVEAFKPFEFSKPAEPFKPIESSFKPIDSLKPVESFKPVETVKAFEPLKIVQVIEPKVIEPKQEIVAPSTSFSFGNGSTTNFAKTETPSATATTPFASFSFGAGNSFSSTSTATEEKPSVAFTPFSFGSSSKAEPSNVPETAPVTAAAPAAFSFGSTATTGTESSPFAFKPFSFGAASTLAEQPAATEAPKLSFGSTNTTALPTFSFGAAAGSTGGFSFNVPAVTAAASKAEQSGGEDDEIPAEEAESFNITRSNSEQFKTGAGEENESSMHEERCKLYMGDSTGGWTDLGVGIFKINRYNNETGKSRVLCRTEGNGKVILNTLVSVPGTEVSGYEGKKEVALLAFGPEGKLTKYLIRVKNVDLAVNLKAALLSEIEYVRANKN